MSFQKIDQHTAGTYKRFTVEEGLFRHDDGEEVIRQWINPGDVVAVLPYSISAFWLGWQPREVTGGYQLGLCAGKIDPGEEPEQAAERELAEEFGLTDVRLQDWGWFYSSEGITDEKCYLFGATDISRFEEARIDRSERVNALRFPIYALEEAIDRVTNAKAKIALMKLWKLQTQELMVKARFELEDMAHTMEILSNNYRNPEDYETFDWAAALRGAR